MLEDDVFAALNLFNEKLRIYSTSIAHTYGHSDETRQPTEGWKMGEKKGSKVRSSGSMVV